jgi:hypothetical protein
MSVASERQRRLDLWHKLSAHNLDDIEPQLLRQLGIYGGAQGIWVDKAHTASSETGVDGVAVGILHTGRHYADDLSEDGVIYHYPKTARPPARDAAEVQATKNAMIHKLPVFVVLPGKRSKARRSLRLGWISDFDDENAQFLILFDGEKPPLYQPAEAANEPFQLMTQRALIAALRADQYFPGNFPFVTFNTIISALWMYRLTLRSTRSTFSAFASRESLSGLPNSLIRSRQLMTAM